VKQDQTLYECGFEMTRFAITTQQNLGAFQVSFFVLFFLFLKFSTFVCVFVFILIMSFVLIFLKLLFVFQFLLV